MLQNNRNLQIWNTSVFPPSVSPNFFTLFLDSFFGLLCFRFRLTGVSSIILFRARTLVVLRHGVLANWLVECFSLVVPNMVLSKLNIQKLVSQQTRGRYTFRPLWVSDKGKYKFSLSRLKTRLRVAWGKKYTRRAWLGGCATLARRVYLLTLSYHFGRN